MLASSKQCRRGSRLGRQMALTRLLARLRVGHESNVPPWKVTSLGLRTIAREAPGHPTSRLSLGRTRGMPDPCADGVCPQHRGSSGSRMSTRAQPRRYRAKVKSRIEAQPNTLSASLRHNPSDHGPASCGGRPLLLDLNGSAVTATMSQGASAGRRACKPCGQSKESSSYDGTEGQGRRANFSRRTFPRSRLPTLGIPVEVNRGYGFYRKSVRCRTTDTCGARLRRKNRQSGERLF